MQPFVLQEDIEGEAPVTRRLPSPLFDRGVREELRREAGAFAALPLDELLQRFVRDLETAGQGVDLTPFLAALQLRIANQVLGKAARKVLTGGTAYRWSVSEVDLVEEVAREMLAALALGRAA